MIVIGHKFIDYKPFYFVNTIEEIKRTESNSVVVLNFSEENIELLKYCQKNSINFGVFVNRIKEIIFANALGANFLIVEKEFGVQSQKIADEYLFDAKILILGREESDIEFVALNFIDGIIFKNSIRGKL